MKRLLIGPLMAISVFAPTNASGAAVEQEIEELRRQLAAVSQRLEELAAENADLRHAQDRTATAVADVEADVSALDLTGTTTAADAWPNRVKLDGDFRYRYEDIDVEGSSSRTRNRIRARTNVKAAVAENIDIGFGLATGGDDPVSTNQTLGGGGSSKSIVLNLAYADWEISDGLHLVAGKFKNPLTRVGGQALIWDGDWTPEGIALTYKQDWFFANVIGSFLESDTRQDNDNLSWGAQIGASGELGGAKVKGGVAYYSIGTKGESTTFGDSADPGDYFGNSAIQAGGLPCGTTPGAECTYLYNYQLAEVFAEAAIDVGDWPALVFFDYVRNSDASENDTSWSAGARFGQAKDLGQVQFTYLYADKEADSMLGLLTDSDFGGGGTDSKGHFLQVNYGVNKNWIIGAQYFINETNLSSGNKQDYNRLMLDAQWKWK